MRHLGRSLSIFGARNVTFTPPVAPISEGTTELKLSQKQAEAIALKASNLSDFEVAAILKKSRSTITRRLGRARLKIATNDAARLRKLGARISELVNECLAMSA